MRVTLATFAHNEEASIKKHLDAWLGQALPSNVSIEEILVVADGCTDQTVPIVKHIQERHGTVRLIEVHERRGITPLLNIIFRESKGDIMVLQPADTIPDRFQVKYLTRHFEDCKVGAVVGRSVPDNDPRTLFGYAARLLYEWNYVPGIVQVDFEGATAIRNGIVSTILESLVDNEAYVHRMITIAGYRVVYEPLAKTTNRGPDNIHDFLRQRRRNLFMHLQARRAGIASPHSEITKVLPLIVREIMANPRKTVHLSAIAMLSGLSYLVAVYDLTAGKSHMRWQMISSSKSVVVNTQIDRREKKPRAKT